jgi:molecular chaperone HscB
MQSGLEKSFFEVFGLPESFDIDLGDLARLYRELQSQLHPDRHATAAEAQRRLSVQMTAHVNEAYQTLKDPLRRARYLLRLRGIEDSETDTRMDPEFLMEQMSLREALDDARGGADPTAPLEKLRNEVSQAHEQRLQQLRDALAAGDADALDHALALTRELQFLEKLLSEIEQLEDDLLP